VCYLIQTTHVLTRARGALRRPPSIGIFVVMRAATLKHPSPEIRVRAGVAADLEALADLETKVFATDRMSRRSLQHFLSARTAAVLVAEYGDRVTGSAVVLFRPNSAIARLYSIAVAPHCSGNGIGPALLTAAEDAALARDCLYLRLEVHEKNQRAIARYRKAGYREFGRHDQYYEDKGHALRFEKLLMPHITQLKHAPPYFHQTTEFTCGPACMMMTLAWADRSFRPSAALEFRLWREATTIFMSSGPGGCEPYGLAVTLKRHGLSPEVHVSRHGPYFLETAKSADKRRVMRVTQEDFRREAESLGVATHLTRDAALVPTLIEALDSGATAIVLVSGHQMMPTGSAHWVFAFGHEGRYVLVHDPAAMRDDKGRAEAAETHAVPSSVFARMTRYGRDKLSAAVIVRKGGHA
jgi:ribosomal protein S18 acetylase RimI-like enzyme